MHDAEAEAFWNLFQECRKSSLEEFSCLITLSAGCVSPRLLTFSLQVLAHTSAAAILLGGCSQHMHAWEASTGPDLCAQYLVVQIGLEFLVDHSGNDPGKWAIVQIFYNGQVFANTTELNTAFADTTSGLNRQQVC